MPYGINRCNRSNRSTRSMNMNNQCCSPYNNQRPVTDYYDSGANVTPMRMMRDCSMKNMSLATAYVLPQMYKEMYEPSEALEKGTCFPELYMPYEPCSLQAR